MAHMIDQSTGRPAIAYAGETPWHRLGRKMGTEERTNVLAAMKLAGLDWAVDRIQLQYQRPATQSAAGGIAPPATWPTKVPDAYGIIRTDTGAYLGTVGAQFQPVQNAEAFDVLQPLVSDHGCTVEVMAGLDGGRRQFALVRMPDATVTPAPGDDVRGYLLVTNAHDGSSAVRVVLTPIRVVCQNTLSAAMSGKHTTAYAVRHTKTAQDRLAQAREMIDRMRQVMEKTGETYAQLADRQMNAKELAEYIEQVIPAPASADGTLSDVIKARRETIADLIFNGRHVAGGADAATGVATAWRAYNAVTEYFDHVRAREAKSASARLTAYDSALFGGNAAIKASALRQLVAA